jgi:hypothetical protein
VFAFDIETLGTKSNSAILSMACIHFEPDQKYNYDDLLQSAFFAKFDIGYQKTKFNRTINKSTIDWWSKQCDHAKKKSFIPTPNDLKFEDGYELMRQWANSKSKNQKEWVWARGNLDQSVLSDIEDQMEVKPIFFYNRWRDVRTAIDIFAATETGYCDIPNFDPGAHVIKHDPVADCAYDIMLLTHASKE